MNQRSRCTVCNHAQRGELEEAHIAGATIRDLAKRFDRAKSTMQRHLREHVPVPNNYQSSL